MRLPPPLLRPARSAHAAIRGYLYQRCRQSCDLDDLLRTTEEELVRWSATPRAVALRAVIDEVAELGRLLHDGTRELRADPAPGHLLTAAYEVVPFHTDLRRSELDALASWCDDDARVSVWLWTGEGGTGKTRLMIEWCRQLRAQGWHAGFLHRYLDGDIDRLAQGKVPRMVVVDYAETRQDVVRRLLYKVATAGHGPRCWRRRWSTNAISGRVALRLWSARNRSDGRKSVLTVLTRLASRRPEEERWLARAFEEDVEELAEPALAVAVEVGDPIGQVLARSISGVSGELAKRLMDWCDAEDYQRSVPLREIAREATRRCFQTWRTSPEPDEDELESLWRLTLPQAKPSRSFGG